MATQDGRKLDASIFSTDSFLLLKNSDAHWPLTMARSQLLSKIDAMCFWTESLACGGKYFSRQNRRCDAAWSETFFFFSYDFNFNWWRRFQYPQSICWFFVVYFHYTALWSKLPYHANRVAASVSHFRFAFDFLLIGKYWMQTIILISLWKRMRLEKPQNQSQPYTFSIAIHLWLVFVETMTTSLGVWHDHVRVKFWLSFWSRDCVTFF